MRVERHDEHPTDDALFQMACNELDARGTATVMAHLEICSDCAAVWSAVAQVREAAQGFDPGAIPAPRLGPRFGAAGRWLGVAAAALLAVGLWATLVPVPAPDGDGGGPDPQHAVRSGQAIGPAPISPSENERVTVPLFTWGVIDDAASYSIEVLDEDGDVLWAKERLRATEASWPSEVEMAPGWYYWRVQVHFEDGEDTQSSSLIGFQVEEAR